MAFLSFMIIVLIVFTFLLLVGLGLVAFALDQINILP